MNHKEYKTYAKELLNSILSYIENIRIDNDKKLYILSIFKEKFIIYNEFSQKSLFKEFSKQKSYKSRKLFRFFNKFK